MPFCPFSLCFMKGFVKPPSNASGGVQHGAQWFSIIMLAFMLFFCLSLDVLVALFVLPCHCPVNRSCSSTFPKSLVGESSKKSNPQKEIKAARKTPRDQLKPPERVHSDG